MCVHDAGAAPRADGAWRLPSRLAHPTDVEDAFQASFVVLIRRAGSLRRQGSLGGWLYTVAYRIALKARAASARRRSREEQVGDIAEVTFTDNHRGESDPAVRASHRELAGVLDAAMACLPEKYRGPLVLCYFEGKTSEEAARELGYAVGSMSWRLEKGRELLRHRLAGRGMALSATALTVALAEQMATAAPPALLWDATVRTALQLVAGKTDATSVSVAALAEGMLQGMAAAKLRVVAIALLLLSIAGAGAGALAYRALADPTVPPEDASHVSFDNWVEHRVEQWQPTRAERRIDDIGWARDIRTALKLAKDHQRPVFLFTHTGNIGTGRCGGSAFHIRAHTLADDRVIDAINRCFVPVFGANEEYTGSGAASPEEKAERHRIFVETVQAKLDTGEDRIYILNPDGKVFDSISIRTAKQAEQFLARLEKAVQTLGTRSGEVVVRPKSLSVPSPAGPDDLVLHLTARAFNRKAWCEFPAENWLVLQPAEWEQFVPGKTVAVGSSWDIPPALSARLLTCFYPQTENNDLAANRLDRQVLRARVTGEQNGVAHVRLDGELRLKHRFYPNRADDLFAEATLVGFFDFDLSRRRLRSLRLVTEKGTYAGHDFGVAVRSVP